MDIIYILSAISLLILEIFYRSEKLNKIDLFLILSAVFLLFDNKSLIYKTGAVIMLIKYTIQFLKINTTIEIVKKENEEDGTV